MHRPTSKEKTSDSVELCETEVCFLHIQLMATNVRLPEIHGIPPEVDFEFSRSPANRNPGTIPICNAVQYIPHDNIRAKRVSHALVHFCVLVPVFLRTTECLVHQLKTFQDNLRADF